MVFIRIFNQKYGVSIKIGILYKVYATATYDKMRLVS